MNPLNRRDFLKSAGLAAAGLASAGAARAFPRLAAASPNDRINIGVIGCGRIAREHDIPGTLPYEAARIAAVCDLDRKRLLQGKEFVEQLYARKTGRPNTIDVKMYDDFRELCAESFIDAVIISTPDHWHAVPAVVAAQAGKDVYLQKPAALTIAEGRAMSDTIHRTGRILQIGSQQRSLAPWPQFHRACELVRNGRIGELRSVQIGLPTDPAGRDEPDMPVPENLNYNMWLGSTPEVYYTEKRVHPQNDYSRPGWLRCEQFGAGMITGWGAHHIDTAHWAMGTEFTGPVEIEGEAEFPKSGLWDVHGKFRVEAKYPNGVAVRISSDYPNGVRFQGSQGWIFVTRGDFAVTASDPKTKAANVKSLAASDPKILESVIGPNEIRLYQSPEQHGNWLDCIRTRRLPVAPAEVGHRTLTACLVSHAAMKLRRKLYWDPVNERFKNDAEANGMLSRPMRVPWVGYL